MSACTGAESWAVNAPRLVSIASSSPSAISRSSFDAVREVPTVRAPRKRASCTAAVPTPLPDGMNEHAIAAGDSRPVHQRIPRGEERLGIAAASAYDSARGIGIASSSRTTTRLGLRATADEAHDTIAGLPARRARTAELDGAGILEPGNLRRPP